MRIILDMDEVLCDFIGGVCRLWGISVGELLPYWTPGVWEMCPALSRYLGLGEGGITPKYMWDLLEGDHDFWVGLERTSWFEDLLRKVGSITEDWYIVSSPGPCESSYSGKVAWLRKNFGKNFNRFALIPHKHLFANSFTVLIDDKGSTVEEFIQAGGKGIIFPRHNNKEFRNSSNPIVHVFEELEGIIRN